MLSLQGYECVIEITDPDSGVVLSYSAVEVAQKHKGAAEEW